MAVTDEAIDKIKTMILSGELTPGARLPREADLAADLGVSRNSLREAVKALSLVRILDVRQGDGTYVTSLDAPLLIDALGFLLDFHQDDSVLDFLAVRRILEPAATALAARNLTTEAIATIKQVIAADSLQTPGHTLVEHDLKFHALIAAGSGNPVLTAMLESISLPTSRARIWRGLTQEGAYARTLQEHADILRAIENREPELAAARAVVHIAGVEDWLRRVKDATSAADSV
ncbi:DNA-binding FadR family transcriptional regulator [Nakamurella sp. UYEF19]|uniref:FadR/GntR family transcriptional regulator n=1 Tax=Nakamurella sp. UYEF19 TaxID=1756392 RepID=UPI003395A3BF